MFSPLVERLVNALKILPSVGPKSAQRMALHLLERDPEGANRLVSALTEALDKVGRCTSCRNLSETPVCGLCSAIRRDRTTLCVVESPADLVAIESSGTYSGLYFVLLGKLSPIEGLGPDEIGAPLLAKRLDEGEVAELILATNSTMEGEATAHFLSEMARSKGVKVSRIAQGVPLGGELEYVDGGTLAHAFSGRNQV